MDPAGHLAHRAGAEVVVLHVAAPGMKGPSERGTLAAPRYLDQPQHEWPVWGAEFLDRMTALGHPPAEVKFRLSMTAGGPGEEIVRFALDHNIDLVVLAWHGRWEGERAPTMKKVIRDSACPVFVLRTEPKA
jgi:nucleotide-binding universal stress UspA family protein